MFSIINKLKGEGNLRLYLDFRSGHAADLSPFANPLTTLAGTMNNRLGFTDSGLGSTTYAHSTNLNITADITIMQKFWDYSKLPYGGFPYTLWKAGSYCTGLGFETPPRDPRFRIYNGALASELRPWTAAKNPLETMPIAWSFSWLSGGKPLSYINGQYIGEHSVALAIGTGTNALQPQYYWGRGPVAYIVIVARTLTATEHALLFAELEAIKYDRNI